MTGPWSRVPAEVARNPRVALVIDTCDLTAGECLQVVASGLGEVVPYDAERGRRKLERYLGSDHNSWDERFQGYLSEEPGTRWLRIRPTHLTTKDLSFVPSLG